jgi:hypothetical protein
MVHLQLFYCFQIWWFVEEFFFEWLLHFKNFPNLQRVDSVFVTRNLIEKFLYGSEMKKQPKGIGEVLKKGKQKKMEPNSNSKKTKGTDV